MRKRAITGVMVLKKTNIQNNKSNKRKIISDLNFIKDEVSFECI